MLRINLLPPYIYEGSKRRNVMVLWVVILLAVIGGFVFAKMQIDNQTAALVQEKDRLTPDADKADRLQAQANTINSESAAIREKRDFVKNARLHNSSTYQPVVYNIRDYTMKGVLYYSLIPSGQTVSLDAYAGSLAQIGHYLMWMEHNPAISQVAISLSGLPTFPVPPGFNGQPQGANPRPPGAGGYDFGVTLTLNKPIPPGPAYQSGGAAAAGGAPQGGGSLFTPGMTAPSMGGPPGASAMPGMSSGMGPGGMGGAPMAPMSAGAQTSTGPAGGSER